MLASIAGSIVASCVKFAWEPKQLSVSRSFVSSTSISGETYLCLESSCVGELALALLLTLRLESFASSCSPIDPSSS